MSNLCIIPARGGSKRIPKKNIKNFLGKPIIAYSIEVAIESKLFDEVMVSTDDNEIKEVAIKYGASVPFKRSSRNSDDFSTTFDVIKEVVEAYADQNKNHEIICCIYPCAPLIKKNILIDGFNLLMSRDLVSTFPVAEYSSPIQRALKLSNDIVSMFNDNFVNSRSQDLEKSFFDAGQFYWMNKEYVLENQNIYSPKSGGVVVDNLFVQDIDNQNDWLIAEMKYKLLNNLI